MHRNAGGRQPSQACARDHVGTPLSRVASGCCGLGKTAPHQVDGVHRVPTAWGVGLPERGDPGALLRVPRQAEPMTSCAVSPGTARAPDSQAPPRRSAPSLASASPAPSWRGSPARRGGVARALIIETQMARGGFAASEPGG